MKYYSGDAQMFRYDNGIARKLDGTFECTKWSVHQTPLHSDSNLLSISLLPKFKSIANCEREQKLCAHYVRARLSIISRSAVRMVNGFHAALETIQIKKHRQIHKPTRIRIRTLTYEHICSFVTFLTMLNFTDLPLNGYLCSDFTIGLLHTTLI